MTLGYYYINKFSKALQHQVNQTLHPRHDIYMAKYFKKIWFYDEPITKERALEILKELIENNIDLDDLLIFRHNHKLTCAITNYEVELEEKLDNLLKSICLKGGKPK